MQNGCQFHIKFHEESKNELYFNLRSYPMKAEVKPVCNFEPSFIKSNIYKIGIYSRARPTILLYLLFLIIFQSIRKQIVVIHLTKLQCAINRDIHRNI